MTNARLFVQYPEPTIQTVTGRLSPALAGITDAHNHLWIERVPGVQQESLILDDRKAIQAELIEYRRASGRMIVDCQPGQACGRNGLRLRQLSQASGVAVVASTGFHLPIYYPPGPGILSFNAQKAYDHFLYELTTSLAETDGQPEPVQAGMLKVACQVTLKQSPLALLEAAVAASLATGSAVQVHTEMGADAENIVNFLLQMGLSPGRLILCHMDKRPDFLLHQSLAQAGIALEYDTFYRPKYQPEHNLWPLLIKMVEAGLAEQVILATDMVLAHWSCLGGMPGLTGLLTQIIPRLHVVGFSAEEIQKLTGSNIAQRLAIQPIPPIGVKE